MITHVVLMKPKPDLPDLERRAFVASFEHALREIPTVRGVRIGKRITFGAGYESLSRESGDYLAIVDFDDLAGLQAYLQHPAHEELGARFYTALSSAMVFDYEVGGVEKLAEI